MIASIISVPVDDGVEFRVKRISEIMDEAEYPGIRISMETEFDGVITPLKIDISTGDAITPREVRYSFKLMLEDRSIEIWRTIWKPFWLKSWKPSCPAPPPTPA